MKQEVSRTVKLRLTKLVSSLLPISPIIQMTLKGSLIIFKWLGKETIFEDFFCWHNHTTSHSTTTHTIWKGQVGGILLLHTLWSVLESSTFLIYWRHLFISSSAHSCTKSWLLKISGNWATSRLVKSWLVDWQHRIETISSQWCEVICNICFMW